MEIVEIIFAQMRYKSESVNYLNILIAARDLFDIIAEVLVVFIAGYVIRKYFISDADNCSNNSKAR